MPSKINKQTYSESGQEIELKNLSGIIYIDSLLNKREGAPIKWMSDSFLSEGVMDQSKTVISYSFPTGSNSLAGYAYQDDVGEISPIPFSSKQQEDTRAAFKEIEKYINVAFVEVIETEEKVGTIRLAINTITDEQGNFIPGVVATAEPPFSDPRGGDIWFNKSYAKSDFSTGLVAIAENSQSIGSQTPIGDLTVMYHEIFHALGVEHPNDNPDIPFPEDKNSREYTVMAGEFSVELASIKIIDEKSYAIPSTPMAYDVAALQYLYGPNTKFNSGNTTYTFDPNIPEIKLIWDGGGTDTLNFSNFSESSTINLTDGSYSTIPFNGWFLKNNLSIAFGAVIENVITGSGADVIIGNSSNNVITGGLGGDTIDGDAGIDQAVYTENFTDVSLVKSGTVWNIASGTDKDTLSNIERLKFNDKNIALDLDGNAGKTVKLLAALLGKESATNETFVGAGLKALDDGMSYEDLMKVGLDVVLGTAPSGASVVDLLYKNLVGSSAPQSILDEYGSMIDSGSMTATSLGIAVADHSLTATNIDLIGLAQTGVEYILYG
ncbi:M10 family metallopeptidase C-terminal domain-containing protein [Gammaproteobacteria bacterium]|nr:M10 family metallopeptidase C-terminal domain-containing protein [Gammaproteobacteria bacterium]